MQPTTFMLVAVIECSCWLILVRSYILCCWLSWPLNQVIQNWWKKVDTHHDGGNMYFACVMTQLFYCKAYV